MVCANSACFFRYEALINNNCMHFCKTLEEETPVGPYRSQSFYCSTSESDFRCVRTMRKCLCLKPLEISIYIPVQKILFRDKLIYLK